jgi:hypothetical protein
MGGGGGGSSFIHPSYILSGQLNSGSYSTPGNSSNSLIGSYGSAGAVAGNGTQGVVIVYYPGSQKASGGTVTSSGGYTYHTFTSAGSITF